MVWEWIYIQRPFVKSLIDCWAFKSSTACKYAGVTQRKQHSHAPVGTKVSDISRRRGKQTGRRRALPALDGCSVSQWSVCVDVSERGRHTGRITGAWMHFAAKRQIIGWSQNDAGLLNFTGERGEPSGDGWPGDGWHYSSSRLPSWLLSVCWRGDGSSGSLPKFLSAWWANSGFRALWGGATVAMISLALWWMDSMFVALSVNHLALSFPPCHVTWLPFLSYCLKFKFYQEPSQKLWILVSRWVSPRTNVLGCLSDKPKVRSL